MKNKNFRKLKYVSGNPQNAGFCTIYPTTSGGLGGPQTHGLNFSALRMREKGFIQATCWDISRWKSNPKSKNKQTDASCTKLVVVLCYIFLIYFNTTSVICSFFKGKQSTCQVLNTVLEMKIWIFVGPNQILEFIN